MLLLDIDTMVHGYVLSEPLFNFNHLAQNEYFYLNPLHSVHVHILDITYMHVTLAITL